MPWSSFKSALQEKLAKLWLGIAFLLVAALAFEAGWLKRSLGESEPLIIAAPTALPAPTIPVRQAGSEANVPATTSSVQKDESPVACAFVGSKKSNKYHLPTSRCAKQIKSENRLCFASVEAAKAKGYLAGCLE